MLIGNYFKSIKKNFRNHFFSGISFNSSETKPGDIFFAIKGNKLNGNKFINEAIYNGAKIIVYENKFSGLKKGILFISSKNVRKSLAILSYKIYKNKPKNLVAVTGTNGKSSVADFYYQILKLNKKKVASIGTLGIKTERKKINVSNTTLNPMELGKNLEKLKKEKIDNVILEASSHGLKQNRLDGLFFGTGIFTNLSHDHLDYHKNFKDYLDSKLYLFDKLLKKKGNLITDNSIKEYKKIKNISNKKKHQLLTISEKENGSIKLVSHKFDKENQIIKILYKKNFYNLKVNLIGKIQIKNLLMAMVAAEKSGVSFKKIANIVHKIQPVNGRLENIGKTKNKSLVVLDYAHSPDALKTCLDNLKNQFKNKKLCIVFGCGGERDKYKRPIMGKIANDYCDKIFLTDDNPRKENPKKIRLEIKKKINKKKLIEISDRSHAIQKAINMLKTGEVLLVAGKGHENIQDYGNKKRFFSDKKNILNLIKNKNKTLSKNFKINILKEQSKKNKFNLKLKINNASINSKEINKNDIFFAIRGKKNDGNLYLKEVFKKKASLAFVNTLDKKIKLSKQIKVKNPLKLLTSTSTIIRENINSKIIAITGSCGKTSLKELLAKTLKKFGNVTYSKKSYNNKFGVPLSLFNLKKNDNFGVFEVGMDKKGEIDFLSKIIKPDIGVITNISYAHAKNFKNIKQISLAKSEIINNIKDGGFIVLNADDNFFNFHKKLALKKKLKILSFGINNKKSNIKLLNVIKISKKFKLRINVNNVKMNFYVSSNNENDIRNLLAAIAVIYLIIDIKKLKNNIFFGYRPPSGRGDISKINICKKNIFLIDESYNSNPLSLNSAIKNFDKIKVKQQKKYLILGDMLELGKHSKKLHLSISKTINQTSISKINVMGKHIMHTFKNIKKEKKGEIINKPSQIIDLIKYKLNNNDYLMIKGSNSTGLFKFVKNIKNRKLNAL